MKKFLADFFARLSSRKFLVTIFGITAVTAYPQYADSIISIIVAYLGAEGAADVVKRYQDGKVKVEQLGITKDAVQSGAIELTVDKETIVPGGAIDPQFPLVKPSISDIKN